MKKTLLVVAILAILATGCKKNEGNNPAKKTADRSEYVGKYSYTITGTAKLNLTLIGENDFPISMDGTMTVSEDPEDPQRVVIVSSYFETSGVVTSDGLEIEPIMSEAAGEDDFGEYSMSYTILSGVATLNDGVLTWESDIEVEMEMTIAQQEVNGGGKGKVTCRAVKNK